MKKFLMLALLLIAPSTINASLSGDTPRKIEMVCVKPFHEVWVPGPRTPYGQSTEWELIDFQEHPHIFEQRREERLRTALAYLILDVDDKDVNNGNEAD